MRKTTIWLTTRMALLWSLGRTLTAYDIFQGFFHGTPCIHPRSITGCNGTLISNFNVSTNSDFSINKPDTNFFLFTRRNQDRAEFLHDCGGTLPANTNYNPNEKTKVIIHGYFDGVCKTAWQREMKHQILLRGNYNVILVDYSWENFPDTGAAFTNFHVVGDQVAFVINNVIKKTGQNPASIHLIGHSLGALVSGVAGRKISNLGRITGLDPGYPGFKTDHYHFTRDDATLVDAIHTASGECLITGSASPLRAVGHADFYVNGGQQIQISCYSYLLISILKGDLLYVLASVVPFLCSHLQSLQYYKVTINPGQCDYTSYACSNYDDFESGYCGQCEGDGNLCQPMGFDFPSKNFNKLMNGSVKYYLDTQLLCPYCGLSPKVVRQPIEDCE